MKKKLGQDAIYDARELGMPRMLVLGLQHLFAMFGATVLVPILVQGYGLPLSIQTTLLFAGLGTIFFHLCTKLYKFIKKIRQTFFHRFCTLYNSTCHCKQDRK